MFFIADLLKKKTIKLHQSLVISTLEYIPKEKGGKRRLQKNIGTFLEGGKSTLEVAKTLDKIGFFKNKTEEEKNSAKPGKIGRGCFRRKTYNKK